MMTRIMDAVGQPRQRPCMLFAPNDEPIRVPGPTRRDGLAVPSIPGMASRRDMTPAIFRKQATRGARVTAN